MKKFLLFPVKKKKLFERSEFFFFRKRVKILASERQPAPFFGQVLNNSSFCFFFFVRTKEKEKPCGYSKTIANKYPVIVATVT